MDPKQAMLNQALEILPDLIARSQETNAFPGKWQIIRTRLNDIKHSLQAVLDSSPSWHENSLLSELLPSVLSTLNETGEHAKKCKELTFSGKLHMQSDLDVLVTKFNFHQHHLNVIIDSGVLEDKAATNDDPQQNINDTVSKTRDLLARLQIGTVEDRDGALSSLIDHLTNDKLFVHVIDAVSQNEKGIRCLAKLLDSSDSHTQEHALAVTSVLVCNKFFVSTIISEGAVSAIVKILDSAASSAHIKERAARILECITKDDPENCREVSAYGGVEVLVINCVFGDSEVRAASAKVLRNLSAVDDLRNRILEQNALRVLNNMVGSGVLAEVDAAAQCLQRMAAEDEELCHKIANSGTAECLLRMLKGNTAEKQRCRKAILQTMKSLTVHASESFLKCESLVNRLTELLSVGEAPSVRVLAAGVIGNVCAANEGVKKRFGEAGCVGMLVRMMESSKWRACQEETARALSLMMSVDSNRKEMDEEGVRTLVGLLDAKRKASVEYPLAALLALSNSSSGRRKIVSCGGCITLERLAEREDFAAKKVLRRIAGNKLRRMFSNKW